MCNPVACAKSNCAGRVLLLCPSSDNCGNICAIYSSDVLLLVGSHIVLFLLDVDRMGTQQYSKVFFSFPHVYQCSCGPDVRYIPLCLC